jgi:hypothetical protein
MLAGLVVATATILATPAVQTDGLGGVSGWQPSPNVCGDGNTIAVLIGNGTAPGCGRSETMQAPGSSDNFTVQPCAPPDQEGAESLRI